MIEAYWREMFGAWSVDGLNFDLPGFPELLMSPRFGTLNQVRPVTSSDSVDRWLCCFSPLTGPGDPDLKSEELPLTNRRDAFWSFHEEANPEGIPFLRRLVPFLVSHNLPHRHLWLEEDGRIIASLLSGETSEAKFLFNCAVAPSERGRGLAHKLLIGARSGHPSRPSFYWTRHYGFFLGADQVYGYFILQ